MGSLSIIFFFFIDKKQIYYKAKIKKRNPSKKDPNHTQEVYKEEPKRLADKTKDKTATRRSGSPKKRTKHKKDLPSPQPGQKIYQRVRLFDTMSIGQCPQFTQEETFCPLIRSYLIFKNQQVPIVSNSPAQANRGSHPNVFAFFTHRSPLPRKEHLNY